MRCIGIRLGDDKELKYVDQFLQLRHLPEAARNRSLSKPSETGGMLCGASSSSMTGIPSRLLVQRCRDIRVVSKVCCCGQFLTDKMVCQVLPHLQQPDLDYCLHALGRLGYNTAVRYQWARAGSGGGWASVCAGLFAVHACVHACPRRELGLPKRPSVS